MERLAFRIKGDVCPGVTIPSYINNTHSNNEVHSAMAGVGIWPDDRGSVFDGREYFEICLTTTAC